MLSTSVTAIASILVIIESVVSLIVCNCKFEEDRSVFTSDILDKAFVLEASNALKLFISASIESIKLFNALKDLLYSASSSLVSFSISLTIKLSSEKLTFILIILLSNSPTLLLKSEFFCWTLIISSLFSCNSALVWVNCPIIVSVKSLLNSSDLSVTFDKIALLIANTKLALDWSTYNSISSPDSTFKLSGKIIQILTTPDFTPSVHC